MVRGPRVKVARRLGAELPGLTKKTSQRGTAAGATAGKRRRKSAYRLRLEEKQKARFHYGVTESQMRRYVEMARRMPGRLGDNLLVTLERRLDNVVWRLGFAPTIPSARQLVSHGHVRVNGERVDRPGYLTDPGESVSVGDRAGVVAKPERSAVGVVVDEALIVEYYAR